MRRLYRRTTASTRAPTRSGAFELSDLWRIPVWILAKPMYSFAPISVHLRLAALRGTLDSFRSPLREGVLAALEHHLGDTSSPRELRGLARRHFQYRRRVLIARVWPQIRDFAGSDAIEIEGLHHLDEALARSRGAVLVTAHFGHARLIKPILRSRGRSPLLVGARGPRAPEIQPLYTRLGSFVHTRALRLPRASRFDDRWLRTVGEDLPLHMNLRPQLAALARNEAVIILADGQAAQALRRVTLLGIDVHLAPGAFSLARHAGAAALPAFVVDNPTCKHPRDVRLVIHPPLALQVTDDPQADLDANFQKFTKVYEQEVRAHPHNWHWTWVRDRLFDQPNSK